MAGVEKPDRMTRYTGFKKRYNKAEMSYGDGKSTGNRAEKPRQNNKVDVGKMVKMRKRVCLKCRRRGHSLRDCPLAKGDHSTGVSCYKCGASDHTSKDCTIQENSFKYATCFVCKQVGHLASQCTQNPNGLYPNGGGCRFCGSVRHYAKDCTERGGGSKDGGAVLNAEDGLLEPEVAQDLTKGQDNISKDKKQGAKPKKVVFMK